MANGAQTLTVSEIIDRRGMGGFQIWTVVLCGFVLVLDGFDAQVIGFLTPSIAKTTGIPVHTFGPILSASLIGLMVAAMASGPIADRWGRKWVVILSAFRLRNILAAYCPRFVVRRSVGSGDFSPGLGWGRRCQTL